MNKIEQFYEIIKKEQTVILATSSNNNVTMRIVSPVYYQGNILIFTSHDSLKYKQLKENPNCCIAVNNFFAEAVAVFMGKTMSNENKKLRDKYCAKFPGAFDESLQFNGRDAEFLLLKPNKLKGWAFVKDIPTPDGIPTIPFEIPLK